MADESPMRAQYLSLKKQHTDEVLFFRLGDFYEMFDEDALEISALLNLTLTSRNGQPMCGIPYHASRSYIARLLKAGKKIAVCEQTSIPGPGKGLAERKVVEVITPGTTVDEDYLDKGSSNYLAALARTGSCYSFAYIDASTGDFRACSFPLEGAPQRLRRELERIGPIEIIVQESLLQDDEGSARVLGERSGLVVNRWPDWLFDRDRSLRRLCSQFNTASMKGFGLEDRAPEIGAAGPLLAYLDETAKSLLPHVQGLAVYAETDFLGIDESTQRNLELVRNQRDGDGRFCLLECLDETKTAMGARLLKKRVLHALVDADAINARLDAVEALYRSQNKLALLRDALAKALDLERLCARIGMDRAHGKDMVAVRDSLAAVERVEATVAGLFPAGNAEISPLDAATHARLQTLKDLLAAGMADEPSILLTEGNLIREGYNAELDGLKRIKDDGRGALERYLEEERAATGVQALKIKYNRLIGYFFEVNKNNAAALPARFIRRQSMADAERFSTDRLAQLETELNGAAEKVVELEKALFLELREKAKAEIPALTAAARRVAVLDVCQGLARAATLRGWTRPRVDASKRIRIVEGRHPVVEAHLPRGEFVPNDLELDADGSPAFVMVTGPNMAGKSTYLRQSALIILMAQLGSFVPAREADIGIADRIFCRVGASDNLARGESTFLVEMNETANILRNASARSLVVMDEVGRGTGTNDGLAIARAVCEELLDRIGSRTLFATHYHELSRIIHPRLVNRSMAVSERDGDILFLRRIQDGAATESYGIHVAGLAGLPARVLSRAESLLDRLKAKETELAASFAALPPPQIPADGAAFAAGPSVLAPAKDDDAAMVSGRQENEAVLSASQALALELEALDLDRTTPLEALELLYAWKGKKRGTKRKQGIPPGGPELF